MSNALKKAAVYFGFAEEDELTQESPAVRASEPEQREERAERRADRVERPERQESKPRAVAPLRPATQQVGAMHEILTVHPRQYKDAQEIAGAFRDGTPVIINLSQMTDGDARRLIDFSAGLTQGLQGRIERVTTKVYLLTPEHIAVAGGRMEVGEPDAFAH
ncbi:MULTISPECIES: cell division protein SepF [unclassified Agrococcus]|uniref:cell division protein SepF n=1 Tax=unclassified Agrococcus TaxID=2615065 RepID=UPI003609423F